MARLSDDRRRGNGEEKVTEKTSMSEPTGHLRWLVSGGLGGEAGAQVLQQQWSVSDCEDGIPVAIRLVWLDIPITFKRDR